MIRNKYAAAVILAGALVSASPAVADQGQSQGRGNDKGNAGKSDPKAKHDDKPDTHEDKKVVVVDRDGYRRIVTGYYSREALPPGLAKRESLPPGLRKQMQEHGQLPPGLQKHLVLVPQPLLVQLPPVPTYYTRYFAGPDLIVIDTRTHVIVVVLPDVLWH